jgi:hypothetical protein
MSEPLLGRHVRHRLAVHAWVGRYRAEGLVGLVDRSHRPESHPWRLGAQVEALLVQLRTDHPRWGPRRLVHELGRVGVDPMPSRSTASVFLDLWWCPRADSNCRHPL